MRRKPDTVLVKGRSRTLAFRLGSSRYTRNGAKLVLPRPPFTIGNHVYVPYQAAVGVLPFEIRYDKTARALRFTSQRPTGAAGSRSPTTRRR